MKLTFETIDLPTRHAFNIAREAAPRTRRSVLVKIEDHDGVEGWGEAPATPFYGETAETVAALMPLLSAVTARAADGDLFALERIEAALAHAIGRNPAARVAVSMALHDLVGKKLGVPVWKLWGLDPAAAPRSSFTIGIDEPEVMREKVREAAGYEILKIKVGTPRDREVLQMIRDLAPEKTLRVDANTAWTAK